MSAQITLAGRLASDPEMKFTQSGKAITRFTVVTSRRRKNGDQWEDADTTFWTCTAWDQLAEQIVEHLRKGAAVVVTGQAYQNNWEKDGEKHSRIEVRVDSAGPNLRWPPKQAERSKPSSPAAGDPWANGGTPDEPPF
ncbi:single-stranded DNA-binding protein [Sphaerisporangium siamense]|uniref:Single-stranded DNA-binding protein n=1 Tax=Sphaerisporangium siamense TaxID=795645 RepID=A0A7W7D8E6_9ACTN|nr:single-stranded DNA-binding protein [Sphaerisporangium siamense]MBB4702210.1 single-strand DNA-binding protein [Sphaerisporangium siamense]GII87096.1 single-stranded DNA-binding protein [Sphaerisporangium siamense]